MKKFLLKALLSVALILCSQSVFLRIKNTSLTHIANNTLLIMGEHGGGTGVTLNSSTSLSQVLTNKHVCEVIRHKGYVQKDSGEVFQVLSFRQSSIHDLCEIDVAGDLKGGVSLASRSPASFDDAIIAGHPGLIPTIILSGHFSHKVAISVQGEPLPIEAQATDILISPGSSGSAVYNSDGDLAGLVFAGSGQVGFGFIVPYEYVYLFLMHELMDLSPQYITPAPPEPEFSIASRSPNRVITHQPGVI